MDFFITKHAKHHSKHSEVKLSNNDIYSKLFIYKFSPVKPVSPNLHGKCVNPDLSESITAVDSSTQAESCTFSEKTKKKIERLSSELLSSKCKDFKSIEKNRKLSGDNMKGKRKKFHSFSRKSDLCDMDGFARKPRRNFSTDIKRNKNTCEKLGNVKSYMKVFHKKSKFLLDCLQKSILNK